MKTLIDRFGRRIDYLRVSVTDRCNFRCIYCMPEEGYPPTPTDQRLTLAELKVTLSAAAHVGFRKLRFTGGEPLLRNDLTEIIEFAATLPGIEDISLTTNGFLLERLAKGLKESGLTRVNVSLDTLNPLKFKEVARRGDFETVYKGILEAEKTGLTPIKINCVLLRGFNDDEITEFAELTFQKDWHIRFIELMPIRWDTEESTNFNPWSAHGTKGLLGLKQASKGSDLSAQDLSRQFYSAESAMTQIRQKYGNLTPAAVRTNGPAKSYRLEGALGTIGFISQISNDLCANCNRLRLTADGFLRPCLMSDGEVDLKPVLRGDQKNGRLEDIFEETVFHKPERHFLAEGQQSVGRSMSQIGG